MFLFIRESFLSRRDDIKETSTDGAALARTLRRQIENKVILDAQTDRLNGFVIDNIFKVVDNDCDGLITLSELSCALSSLNDRSTLARQGTADREERATAAVKEILAPCRKAVVTFKQKIRMAKTENLPEKVSP